jgi:hypothetical protein
VVDQTYQLMPRVARGAHQVAHHQPLVGPLEPDVPKPAQYSLDMPVAILVLATSAKHDFARAFQKLPQLRQRHQLLFTHVDHHAPNDRSSYRA